MQSLFHRHHRPPAAGGLGVTCHAPHWLAVPLLLALCLGCSGGSKTSAPPSAGKVAPADPWLLTCLDPTVGTPALLWNGQIGVRIGRDGTGAGPMFLIDEYDTTGEEKIRPLENILAGSWKIDGAGLDPKSAADYRQVLDMHNGLLTTFWTQGGVRIKSETVMSPVGRTLAQRWIFDSNSYVEVSYEAAPQGATARMPDPAKWKQIWTWPPSGVEVTEDDELSPDIRHRKPNAEMNGPLGYFNGRLLVSAAADSGRPFAFSRILSIGESPNAAKMTGAREVGKKGPDDVFPDVQESHWAYKDLAGKPESPFDSVATAAKTLWARRWETDIEIDGPVEDQQAVRSFLFYLRSAISPDGKMSISPFGLGNDLYNGHVFWDADIWVFPALALIDPAAAKAIPDYRLAGRSGAAENFNEWFGNQRATATGKMGMVALRGKVAAFKYPWESSVSGKETMPGPSQFEEHINGDVAWMLAQAASLGLAPPKDAQEAREEIAAYWRWRSVHFMGEDHINGVVSPDENHTGSNDLYTNLLAQWCANGGTWERRLPVGTVTTKWYPEVKYKLPHDNISFLNYDNDLFKGYKQAAGILSIYPLQYPPAEKEAKVMMDRFSDKTIKDGPAMTESLNALIWARLDETDKAYEIWEKSWKEFVKEPHLQFSEKRHKPITYFTTGAAGCLQTVLYGFLGFRIDSRKQDGALWSTKLALGQILSVRPNLPKSWKSVKFKNFTVLGRRYTLIASHNGLQVTQGDQ